MDPRLRALVVLLVAASSLFAGTSGKIAGRITAQDTGEPLVGVSVLLAGTTMGAASNIDGNYFVLNVAPGTYTLVVSGVGFQRKQFANVKVSVDFTTQIDVQLSTDVIALETIVVQAEAPMVRRDLTSSHTVVDATAIEALPVESVSQVLALQAGITQGAGGELHIRGGRSNEILYTVNGVSIANPFDNSRMVEIATNAIQELSVVSGTFNAEYGNALSGVVNTVTKEGGGAYHGSLSFYTGDKVSNRSDVFFNIGGVDWLNHWVSEATLSGPIPGVEDYLTFFASAREDNSKGWLYGVRQQNPWDYVKRDQYDPTKIEIISTGDNEVVAMNPSKAFSGTAKLSFTPIAALKIRYDVLYSRSGYRYYDHDLKYNPDASYNNNEWGLLNAVEVRHSMGERTYYTLRGSYNINDFQQYLYPLEDKFGNPIDFHAGMALDTSLIQASRLYEPSYKQIAASNFTFLSGGTPRGHYYQRSKTWAGKFDITSQLTANHEIKSGFEFKIHRMDYRTFTVLRDTINYKTPTILDPSSAYHDVYTKKPIELSAYLQDKMEFRTFVLNIGLRYDYFAARSKYFPDTYKPAENLLNAPAKHMFSPRLGFSFPITDRGNIHFSYGHFYQMPSFSSLYTNPNFESNFASGNPTYGNANLNPQKTVTYELALQQQLADNLAFTVTGFYKDVRDLLATQQIRISGSATYYQYVNKDYGNIRGITFSLVKRRTAAEILGVTVDYTFQVAEGNDTDPDAFFLDLASGRQSEKIPVYLGWDQTHTLNTTVSVGRASDWTLSAVGRIGSGLPYTPQIPTQVVFLRPNSGRKPSQVTVDLLADKTFDVYGLRVTAFAKVFNVFDTLNERYVYNDTGRATYSLEQNQPTAKETDRIAALVPGMHSADEYFNSPSNYASPREVRLGVSVEF